MKDEEKKPVVIPSREEVAQERERLHRLDAFRRMLKGTLAMLAVAAAVSVLVTTLWMPVLRIYGDSMSPTLEAGQIVVAVRKAEYRAGDMVAFYSQNRILIKRCIAGPSDWVSMEEDGTVLVNGQVLEEPYLEQKSYGKTNIAMPYQVPDSHYFMMGDHREASIDSRNTEVGCIAEDKIIGKVVFRIWPPDKLGLLHS